MSCQFRYHNMCIQTCNSSLSQQQSGPYPQTERCQQTAQETGEIKSAHKNKRICSANYLVIYYRR